MKRLLSFLLFILIVSSVQESVAAKWKRQQHQDREFYNGKTTQIKMDSQLSERDQMAALLANYQTLQTLYKPTNKRLPKINFEIASLSAGVANFDREKNRRAAVAASAIVEVPELSTPVQMLASVYPMAPIVRPIAISFNRSALVRRASSSFSEEPVQKRIAVESTVSFDSGMRMAGARHARVMAELLKREASAPREVAAEPVAALDSEMLSGLERHYRMRHDAVVRVTSPVVAVPAESVAALVVASVLQRAPLPTTHTSYAAALKSSSLPAVVSQSSSASTSSSATSAASLTPLKVPSPDGSGIEITEDEEYIFV